MTWCLLGVWGLVVVIALASISVGHLASLPQPGDKAFLSRALLKYRRQTNANFLVHVIYSDCSCASGLLTHLRSRAAFPGEEELILFVGWSSGQERRFNDAGFDFKNITATHLVSDFGLEAAPVLVMFDAAGKMRYVGGYYDVPATVVALDEEIHSKVAAHTSVEPLPVFGCAVSPQLQQSLDRFHILSWFNR